MESLGNYYVFTSITNRKDLVSKDWQSSSIIVRSILVVGEKGGNSRSGGLYSVGWLTI